MPHPIGKKLLLSALTVLCLVFLAAAAAPWVVDPLDFLGPESNVAVALERVRTPALPKFDAPALEHLAAIVERPIFTATRRPAPKPPPARAAASADPPDNGLILGRYRLAGVVLTPNLRLVFVTQLGTNKTIAVKQGEELDGWVVVEVERHTIVLRSRERQETITIRYSEDLESSTE